MLNALTRTQAEAAPLLARLGLAVILFPHGAQKLLGWFGGAGPIATVQMFQQAFGVPAPLAWLVVLTESLGSVALFLGLWGRLAALGVLAVMAGAVQLVHRHFGFFMNWTGQQGGEGFEYHIAVATLALIVLLRGSGGLSMDLAMSRPKRVWG